jgi:hypothetical protein
MTKYCTDCGSTVEPIYDYDEDANLDRKIWYCESCGCEVVPEMDDADLVDQVR